MTERISSWLGVDAVRCVDCREEICTYDRPDAQVCARCVGLMHGECAMSDWQERPVCEACLRRIEQEFVARMVEKWKRREAAKEDSNGVDEENATGGEHDDGGEGVEPFGGEPGGGDRLLH